MRRDTRSTANEEQSELFPETPQNAALAGAVARAPSERPPVNSVGGAAHQRHRERQHELLAFFSLKAAVLVTLSTPILAVMVAFAVESLPVHLGTIVMLSFTGAWGVAARMLYRAHRDHRYEVWRRARIAARFDMISGAVLISGSNRVRARIALLLARDREFSERLNTGETTEQLEMLKLTRSRRREKRGAMPNSQAPALTDPRTSEPPGP